MVRISGMNHDSPRYIILTGVYDDHYLETRNDKPALCTSAGKRLMLYRAIAEAAGISPLLLSPQPRGRGKTIPLPAVQSQFGEFKQLFSRASGIRKVRYFVDMVRYIGHVYRYTRNGDILIFDNYELIYVLAIYGCRILGRTNRVLLEYEDGKHAIDRGYFKLVSALAEKIGRRLVQGAILATPPLGDRLPRHVPKIVIPGILRPDIVFNPLPSRDEPILFIYSGSLDVERGIPLLLNYLESSLMVENTVYHITGQGNYENRFLRLMERYPGKIYFHGCVSEQELERIRRLCYYGLNLQSSSNPISYVTYPSKTFDYLNAGIRVVSTKAAGVPEVLESNAIYLELEIISGLADAIIRAKFAAAFVESTVNNIFLDTYTLEGTISRLKSLLQQIK
jgi:hypothetical protein